MSDLKVALIKPSSGGELAYPLGLAALVEPLARAGFKVEGFDSDLGDFSVLLRGFIDGKYASAGVSIHYGQVPDAASMIRRIKAIDSKVPVFIGGPQPTLFPERSLLETGADVAVMGDGETLFPEALDAFGSGSTMPTGTAVRRGAEIHVNGGPFFEKSPDGHPFPDRTFLPLENYGCAYRSVGYPFASMISSRGCSMSCPHCCAPELRPDGFQARSAGPVAEEMRMLERDFGVKDVHFEDDAFLTDLPRVVSLCETLLKKPSRLIWELVNGVRPEHVDVSLFPLLHRAGCRRIALGVEAICRDSEAGLKGPLRKPYSMVSAIAAAARRNGISLTGYFMLGLPGSTPADDRLSVDLADKLGFDGVHYSVFTPIPGSTFFSGYAGSGCSPESEKLARDAARRFYLKPVRLLDAAIDVVRCPAMARTLMVKGARELAGLGAGPE